MKCNKCPAPAFLRVDDHIVMCAACWTLTIARVTEQMKADFEDTESFVSLNSFSDIGSARETSAMPHPGAVDGSTTSLAGRDSGDRAERRSPNSNPSVFLKVSDDATGTLPTAPAAVPVAGIEDGIPDFLRRIA